MASTSNGNPTELQRVLCMQLNWLFKIILTDAVPSYNWPDPQRSLLRNLNTIATCLATGDSGDVVAVTVVDSLSSDEQYHLSIARNQTPTARHASAARAFFQSLIGRGADKPNRIEILKTVHRNSAKLMDKRIQQLEVRSKSVLDFNGTADIIPQVIEGKLAEIRDVARNLLTNKDRYTTDSKIRELNRLADQCNHFLKARRQSKLTKLTVRNGKDRARFSNTVAKLGRILNKICQYKVGLDKLIEAKRAWSYEWINHKDTSKYAMEFPRVEGDQDQGLRMPGYIEAWHKSGIKVPLAFKLFTAMNKSELAHLYHENFGSSTPDKKVMEQALNAKLRDRGAEVPISDTELGARLTERDRGIPWRAIINLDDKDGGWARVLYPVVHAELRIILEHDSQNPVVDGKYRAIGVSKRCCGSCTLWIAFYNELRKTRWLTSGSHGKYYPNFALPGLVAPGSAPVEFIQWLSAVVQRYLEAVRAKLTHVTKLEKGWHQESDSGVSDYRSDEFGSSSEDGPRK